MPMVTGMPHGRWKPAAALCPAGLSWSALLAPDFCADVQFAALAGSENAKAAAAARATKTTRPSQAWRRHPALMSRPHPNQLAAGWRREVAARFRSASFLLAGGRRPGRVQQI